MTFALSYHSDVPALLAQPRLFLGPEIPGYVSAGGRVMLPMTLNGRMTDTGLHRTDLNGLESFLSRHEDRFVCARPKFTIYNHREKYEAAVRPNWLKDVVDWIAEDVERYESVLDSHPFQRTALQVVKGQMKSLLPIFSACIYLGECNGGDAIHFLYPHDLALYGAPVGLKEGKLYPVLSLLETVFGAHERLRMGMAEKIVVRRETGPSEHDIPSFGDLHGSFVEFALREGALLSLPREQVRPVVEAEEDHNGNIFPFEMEGELIHPAYLKIEHEIHQRGTVFLGFLLLIHYGIDGPLMEGLIRILEGASKNNLRATQEHLQFVLDSEMYEMGHQLSRDDQGFEGLCLLRALQSVTRIS